MSRDGLLLALVFGPFLAAMAVPWFGQRSERLRDGWVMLATGAGLLGAVALVSRVLAQGRLVAGVPLLAGRLEFAADHIGALFALFSAFVWCCATLYSIAYMKTQEARDRYHVVSLVVYGAMFGVVLAADLVTLFLFFETLGLTAFLLVVHTGTPEARRAAIQYFWMTLLGGIALLSGIMLVYSAGGGPLVPGAPLEGGHRVAAAGLLTLGFGVKAGMVPVHFWLPNAHPVAPSPASALLSGVMIKAGAYGIFRSLSALFAPPPGTSYIDVAWAFSAQYGLAITWLGIITMAFGVVLALGQSNAKRMLAYHSISQMGFILAGLGAGAFLLGEGAMGTAGGLMHTINHGLFKASLFLGVGAVAFRTGSLDMYALGGLWRRMPFTFALMLVAAAGITGLPLFNGFVSKSLIHHALEAAHADSGLASLRVAERIFIATAAGTAASFIKLIGLVFLGRSRLADLAAVREAPAAMLAAMALLAVPVVLLGWRPEWLLQGLVAPGLLAAGLPAEGIDHYLTHYFLAAGDVGMSLVIFALGGLIFALGMRFGLFHLHLPTWLSPAHWLDQAGRGVMATCTRGSAAAQDAHGHSGPWFIAAVGVVAAAYERTRQHGGGWLGSLMLAVFGVITRVYARFQHRLAWSLRSGRRHLLLGLGDAGRVRRRLVESLLVGMPGSPAQAFLEAAWGTIEQERHETVKAALARARRDPAPAGHPMEPRLEARAEARIEAARALAGLMAGTVFDARLEALGSCVRGQGLVPARAGFAALHREFAPTRDSLSAAAADLALARSRGEDIARAVAAQVEPVLRREARALAVAAAGALADTGSAAAPSNTVTPLRQSRRRREAIGRWLRDMARLGIAELRQHPSSWPQSESVDTDPGVVSTRRGIQRYARDVGLNVVAIFLLFAFLAVVLWLGAGG